MQKSQNGWNASSNPVEIGIKSFQIPDTDIVVRLNWKAAPLLLAAARAWHNKIEPIDRGIHDDWSYAFREIRGVSGVLSNHSSGTALDINATQHPLGVAGTFTSRQRTTLKQIAKRFGLRSGEFYYGRPDGMHLEMAINSREALSLRHELGLNADGLKKVA